MNFIFYVLLSLPVLKSYPATFLDCYDGDTCTFDIVLHEQEIPLGLGVFEEIKISRKSQKVRLCDINAPEMKPPNDAAIKAKNDIVSWIRAAKKIELKVVQKKTCNLTDSSCDEFEKYGRLLVYIYADDIELNKKQILEKNAVPFIQCN